MTLLSELLSGALVEHGEGNTITGVTGKKIFVEGKQTLDITIGDSVVDHNVWIVLLEVIYQIGTFRLEKEPF